MASTMTAWLMPIGNWVCFAGVETLNLDGLGGERRMQLGGFWRLTRGPVSVFSDAATQHLEAGQFLLPHYCHVALT